MEKICKNKLLQTNAYTFYVNSNAPFVLNQALRARFELRKWFEGCDRGLYSDKASEYIKMISKHVPPCVLHSVLLALFNGWPTAQRFQERHSKCLICDECDENDSIEHYARCSFQWKIFAQRFRVSLFPKSMDRLFGLKAIFQFSLIYLHKFNILPGLIYSLV